VRRALRTAAVLAAAAVLFVILFSFLALPRGAVRLEPQGAWADLARRTVAGGYHVHTTRSDGAAGKPAIAAAAAGAGLQFVIFTDHGDATRPPDPPVYIEGVLCLDGVEISTADGHYVAIDMPQAPYPLGGTARAVAEDVARLGGFGIAAHPDSPKPELRWTDAAVPVDGFEWLNTDSEWRAASRGATARAALGYLVRPAAALASLLHRPVASLQRWDAMTRGRPVVGLAGLDAHGGIGRQADDGSRSNMPGVPRYRDSFRTFSDRVILDRPLSGDAQADARALYGSIRAGRVFTTIDVLAAPGLVSFDVDGPSGRAEMGGTLVAGSRGTIRADALVPRGATLVLVRDGQDLDPRIAAATAPSDGVLSLRVPVASGAGSYRAEVRLASAPGEPPLPWLVSNPIYFLRPAAPRPPPPVVAGEPIAGSSWHIEKDPGSSAILRTRDGRVEVEFALRSGDRANQFVAAATPLAPERRLTSIAFDAKASRPMRISVQLRFDRLPGAPRWGESVYVDQRSAAAIVHAADLRPMQAGESAVPDTALAAALLCVVELTNTPPGRRGIFELSNVRVAR